MNTSLLSSLTRASYGIALAGLVVGIVTLPFNVKAALLPAAAIFGWSQIGGL